MTTEGTNPDATNPVDGAVTQVRPTAKAGNVQVQPSVPKSSTKIQPGATRKPSNSASNTRTGSKPRAAKAVRSRAKSKPDKQPSVFTEESIILVLTIATVVVVGIINRDLAIGLAIGYTMRVISHA